MEDMPTYYTLEDARKIINEDYFEGFNDYWDGTMSI